MIDIITIIERDKESHKIIIKHFNLQKYFLHYILFLITISNYAQAPGGVSNNCVLWIKADDLVLNKGDNVSQWNDACGQGNNATQPDVIHQPTYNEVVQNYNPGVYFFLDLFIPPPGSSIYQYLNVPNLIDENSTTINIFAVGTNEAGSNDFHAMVIGQGDNSWNSGGYCFCSSPTGFGFWVDTFSDVAEGGWSVGGSDMPSSLIEGKYDGFEIDFYFDAENNATTPFTGEIGIAGAGSGTTHIGGDTAAADNHKGHISEVIIYSSALSDIDRNKINSYLAIKYGINGIDREGVSDNIVDSSGQSLFESLTGDYWNGIMGIGRDDASALHQKQSHLHLDETRIYIDNLVNDNSTNTGSFNNNEFVMMGDNDGMLSLITNELPPDPTLPELPIVTRLDREWKVTNTNFSSIFNVDVKLDDCDNGSQINIDDLRLLVDDDGDFSNAIIYKNGDAGLSFASDGEYIKILNIANAHININETKYITFALTTLPIIIDDIVMCDTDGNGFEDFLISDFITIQNQIIADQSGVDNIDFFNESGTLIDLTLATYTNEVLNVETITVGITYDTGCYIETSFDLVALKTPVLDVQVDLVECSGFILPEIMGTDLSGEQAYYTLPNGQDGGGIQYLEGDALSYDDFPSYPVTIYIFDGDFSINCFDEESFQLTIQASPEIVDLDDVMICDAYTLPEITGTNLTGSEAYYDTDQELIGGGISYNEGFVFNYDSLISYPITLYIYDSSGTGSNFCSSQESFELTIYNSIDFDLLETNLEIDFIGTIIINMTDLSVNYEYAVDNDDDSNFQTENVFNNLEEGIHTLYVRDENNCVVKTIDFEIIIILKKIPKFFTPNGDDINDSWVVIDNLQAMKIIHIFDRFGKIVAQIPPNGDGWDGNYRGKPLFTTDYWYKIELFSGKEITGHFSLVR